MKQTERKLSYAEFAVESLSFIKAHAQEHEESKVSSIYLRTVDRYWKDKYVENDKRIFMDITYGDEPFSRTVTNDLQHAYETYCKEDLTLPEVYQIVSKQVELVVSGDEAERYYRQNHSIFDVPRDASVLPMCLDKGESLKAYHKKIGYKLPEGYSYGKNSIVNKNATNPNNSNIVVLAEEVDPRVSSLPDIKCCPTPENSKSDWDEAEEDRSF